MVPFAVSFLFWLVVSKEAAAVAFVFLLLPCLFAASVDGDEK